MFHLANLGLSLRSRLKCQVRKMTETGNDEVEDEFLVSFHYIVSDHLHVEIKLDFDSN